MSLSTPSSSRSAWLLVALLATTGPAPGHEPSGRTLAALDREIATEPRYAELYRERAEIKRLQGEFDAALADLERADRLGEREPLSHFFRGRVLLDAGRTLAARQELERFLALPTPATTERPDRRPAARVLLARASLALDERSHAVDEYLAAVASELDLVPQVYVDCAETAAAAGRPDAALSCLDTGLERLGPSPVLAARAVHHAVAAERFDDALERLDSLARLAPAAGRWRVERGDLLLHLGRCVEADAAYAAALAEIDRLPHERRRAPAIAELETRARAGRSAAATASAPGRQPPNGRTE